MSDKPQIPPGFRVCSWNEATNEDASGDTVHQYRLCVDDGGALGFQAKMLDAEVNWLCPDPSAEAVQLLRLAPKIASPGALRVWQDAVNEYLSRIDSAQGDSDD